MRSPAVSPYPDPSALDALLELWKAAARPVIITGTGAARVTDRNDLQSNPNLNSDIESSDSTPQTKSLLAQLAETTHTPVFYSQKYSHALPFKHPLRGGYAGRLGLLPYIQKQQPDFVLLLGARTGFLLGGRSGAIIPNSGCTLVQVDIDATEIGRSAAVDLGIVADANKFVVAFVEQLQRLQPQRDGVLGTEQQQQQKDGVEQEKEQDHHPNPIPHHDAWLQDITDLKAVPSPYAAEPPKRPDDRLHPYHAMKTIMQSLPSESIVVVDGGEAGVWAAELLELARPATAMVATGYLGFLGNGWGYSLGAAVAVEKEEVVVVQRERGDYGQNQHGQGGNGQGSSNSPSGGQPRLVVNIQGDGSAGFHIQELDTFARHGLNVLTVVFNNSYWGMSVAGQDLLYDNEAVAPHVATRLSDNCRYDLVARGFGCRGVLVDGGLEDLAKAVRELTTTPPPTTTTTTPTTTTAAGGVGAGPGPGLLNAIVSREPVTSTTKAMVGKIEDKRREKDWIVVPYYDNVPRPFYKA